MASSAGPVKAGPAAIAATSAVISSIGNAARGRSASPGQYTSHGALSARAHRADSQGLYSAMTAWPEGATAMASPRTPRQTQGSSDLRLGVAVAELQRVSDNDRRDMKRQLQQLERRFQEQISTPANGRERWADLQGSVSGMLEEMSGLARRVDALDEKLRLRIGGCEELMRQRTRELEQNIHAHEHKVHLASTTSEESQKRQAAKMRKALSSIEEHTRRLDALEEVRTARRPEVGHGEGALAARLEARISELEQRQLSFEEEVHSLPLASEVPSGRMLWRSSQDAQHADKDSGQRDGICDEDDDPVLRSLERDLSALAQRTATQLDDHGAALANLRVRSEGQENRLSATVDRMDTLIATPLEALRSEIAQLREHDRQELESRLEDIKRRVQSITEASEDIAADSRERLQEASEGFSIREADQPMLQRHEQALRRLEALVTDLPQQSLVSPEEFCTMLMRADSLEQRVEFLEKDCESQGLAEKADRTEVIRLDAAVRELSEPLRRLSQRAAQGEARSAALERRVEQLQQHHSSEGEGGAGPSSVPAPNEELMAAVMRVGVISDQVAELKARIIDVEGLIDGGGTPSRGRGRGDESSARFKQFSDEIAEVVQRVSASEKKIAVLQGASSHKPPAGENNCDSVRLDAERLRGDLQALQESLEKLQKEEHEHHSSNLGAVKVQTERTACIEERLTDMERNVDKGAASTAEKDNTSTSLLESRLSSVESGVNQLQSQAKDSNTLADRTREILQRTERTEEDTAALQKKLQSVIQVLESKMSALNETASVRDKGAVAAPDELKIEIGKDVLSKLDAFRDEVGQDFASFKKEFLNQVESVRSKAEAVQALKLDVEESKASLSSLSKQVEKASTGVESSHPSTESVQALKKEVEDSKASLSSLSKQVEEAKKTIEANEAVNSAVRTELMGMSPASGIDDSQLREVKESLSNILDRVSCLEACSSQAAPEQYQEVERRAAELGEQVSAGLSELMKHQQELTAMKAQTRDLSSRCTTATSENGNSSSRYQMPPELEEGLDELTKQVAAELSELRDHQRDLTQAKDKMINVSKVFDEVDRMSGLVADELQELRIHQEELRQAKAVMARNEGVAAPSVDMQQGISELEDKVEKLSAEVISELQALATHQEELRCTKANLRDIAEQVDDDVRIIAGCQKAVLNVKEDVELLRTQSPLASPKASPRDKSTEDSSPAKLTVNELRTSPKSGVSSSTPLQPAGIIEDHVSEVSESYDNDAFDEEDEGSMSAS